MSTDYTWYNQSQTFRQNGIYHRFRHTRLPHNPPFIQFLHLVSIGYTSGITIRPGSQNGPLIRTPHQILP